MAVFVPSSPEKAAKISTKLQHGYERSRNAALYGGIASSDAAPSSTIGEPSLPSRKSTFLATSAIAHRSAGPLSSKSNKPTQSRTYKRNVESDFQIAAPAPAPPSIAQQRDDSLRLIETLPIGPKEVTPPEDDPHFLKLEPTSGIALRQRKMPHPEVDSHLEGRYFIPISTLYSIAVPERSDDGDFSIPVEGDWVTMGVIIKRTEVMYTKPVGIDHLGRRLDKDGMPIVDCHDPFMSQQDKKASKQNDGGGRMKELQSRAFIIFTLLDISSQPDKFGQHDGSREIELAVFESDTSVVEPGGRRKYFGGSNGAYEKLLMATYGLLVCILNPKVRKGYAGRKGQPNGIPRRKDDLDSKEDQSKGNGPTRMRLNARSGNSIALIGVAKDYGQCQQDGCSTFVDKRMKTSLCEYHMGFRLEQTQNGRPQLQSSWRMSTFSNQYSMADGMSGPKSRQIVLTTSMEEDPTLPGGSLFDVSTALGRGKEMRAEDRRRERLAEENQEKQAMSHFRNELSEVKLKERALARIKKAKQVKVEKQQQGGGNGRQSILNSVMFDAADCKVLEASQKAVLERKRQAEIESDSRRRRGKKIARLCSQDTDQSKEADVSLPAGSYRSSNGDVKVLSSISSKLLSRHSVKASELSSKPALLRRKRAKLPPAVKPPPGESFYADESSDEELNILMQSDAMNRHLLEMDKEQAKNGGRALPLSAEGGGESDSDDLAIIPNRL